MIEDKDVKIAENPEEKFWKTAEEQAQKNIGQHKHEIIINEHLLKLFKEKQKI